MPARLADEAEIETWRRDGWALLDGLVGEEAVDGAVADLEEIFPTASQYHGDPEAETERHLGRPAPRRELFRWPDEGPGFRPEQHRWRSDFPFPGSGALNRLCVHPSVVDFARRALGARDLRIYQAAVTAKYSGLTNYEQPMHTDRNHSWLPAHPRPPWWFVEGFLYLSDVPPERAPTHLVPATESRGRSTTVPLVMPDGDPALYAAERPAVGRRGSYLAYRTDVFHRAVDLRELAGARFLLNVSFKPTGLDWVGYQGMQSRATAPEWVRFAAGCSPDELSLFGFPAPGHPVWDAELLDETQALYPGMDLSPWRERLGR